MLAYMEFTAHRSFRILLPLLFAFLVRNLSKDTHKQIFVSAEVYQEILKYENFIAAWDFSIDRFSLFLLWEKSKIEMSMETR